MILVYNVCVGMIPWVIALTDLIALCYMFLSSGLSLMGCNLEGEKTRMISNRIAAIL